MSDCCSHSGSFTHNGQQAVCPVNGRPYKQIGIMTLLHQLRKPWNKDLKGDYYYCSDPDCDVVYFNQQGETFKRTDLRSSQNELIAEKSSFICYCFDVSEDDVCSAESRQQIKDYIIEQTAKNLCACSIRHPSGRCCLKDFK